MNRQKLISGVAVLGASLLVGGSQAFAADGEIKGDLKELKQDRKEMRQDRKEIRGDRSSEETERNFGAISRAAPVRPKSHRTSKRLKGTNTS
jgi:hypothetical protein